MRLWISPNEWEIVFNQLVFHEMGRPVYFQWFIWRMNMVTPQKKSEKLEKWKDIIELPSLKSFSICFCVWLSYVWLLYMVFTYEHRILCIYIPVVWMALQPNLCQPRGPPPEKEERTNRGCAQKEAEMTGAAEGSPDVPCLCGPDPCCIRALVRSASTVLMAGVFRIFVYTPWNEGKPVT